MLVATGGVTAVGELDSICTGTKVTESATGRLRESLSLAAKVPTLMPFCLQYSACDKPLLCHASICRRHFVVTAIAAS